MHVHVSSHDRHSSIITIAEQYIRDRFKFCFCENIAIPKSLGLRILLIDVKMFLSLAPPDESSSSRSECMMMDCIRVFETTIIKTWEVCP